MILTQQIAQQLRDVYFGGNWTASNLKDQLQGVSWEEATTKISSFNTIVTLVYHMNYYVMAVSGVLQEKALNAKDIYSFDHPVINSEKDWIRLQNETWQEVEKLGEIIEKLPEKILFEEFKDPKYGNYFRNITGIIEHTHYHLGQIALLKKLLKSRNDNPENG